MVSRSKGAFLLCLLLMGSGLFAQGHIDPERKAQAQALFNEVLDHYALLELDLARAQLQLLSLKFPEVREANPYTKLQREMAVIGKDAGELTVERWFQDDAAFDKAIVTLVVFWESWCPHCQEEMPKMEKLYEKYEKQGFNVVGLTRLRDPATVSSAIGFIAEYGLTFPIGKDDGTIADRLDVLGVPAAAIIKNGKVIWRGTPERISGDSIEKALRMP